MTYRNVCQWHAQVAHLEMIDHRLLTGDFSVQRSEFSADGGRTGRGIVVNLGRFDGAHAMIGPAWSGGVRGKKVSVPVNGFATYAW